MQLYFIIINDLFYITMNVALIYKKSAWELFSDSDDNNVSSFILGMDLSRDLLLESDLVQKHYRLS